jgi:hypothetical protein
MSPPECISGQRIDRIGSSDQIRSNPMTLFEFEIGRDRATQRPELVALKRGSEIEGSAANHTAHREQLQRDLSIQQGRPLNTHLHQFAHADLFWRDDALGDHQDAAARQVYCAAGSRERRSGEWAEAHAKVQRKAIL